MPGQMVSFPSNGGTAEGYLTTPASGKGPGVIVIQEWWGLNDSIKRVADDFAAEGYLALAPDLYHGKVVAEPDEAGKLMMAMKMDQAAKDMSGAYDYLKNHASGTGKVGSVGYCMGGGLSLYISTLKPMDATVIYYGVLIGVQPNLGAIKGPVLGHYAENDAWASPEAARGLEMQLHDAGKDAEFHIYPGTVHAFFMREHGPEVHNAGAAAESWERTLAFYKRHLS